MATKKTAKKKTPQRATPNGKAPRNRIIITPPPAADKGDKRVTIKAPSLLVAKFDIVGDAPYVQNAFSQKAFIQMMEDQEAGSTNKKGKKREGKDFKACFEGAKHISSNGRFYGIPAAAFRNAAISACRICGYQMVRAKLSIFCLADGMDRDGRTPLVKLTKVTNPKSQPRMDISPVRLPNGNTDLRARPLFDPGWKATVRIRYDSDQFTLSDVANLMMRIGMQVGVGEGRPDSPKSTGMGWGTFELAE